MPNSGNGMRRMQDLKTLSLIIGVTLALASAAWGIVSWAQSLKPRAEARSDHEVLHRRITEVDKKTLDAEQHVNRVEQTIGRDVKTIKCILTAPNRRSKEKCGLQE